MVFDLLNLYYKYEKLSLNFVLSYFDEFIPLDGNQINAIEIINMLDLIRDFSIKNNNDTGNVHTMRHCAAMAYFYYL